tara:strand:+ start:7696 stop:8220 length:525 start_codon:yes stop_codon:yes gene_type:complete
MSAYTENSTSSSSGAGTTGSATTSSGSTTTTTNTEKSVVKPFAAGVKNNSPLEDLVRSALVRAGNFSPSRVDGEVMMMMIELANRVIDEVRKNPYWQGGDIDYFNDPTECRAIPDMVLIDGLTAHYLLQQGSDKAMVFLQLYQTNLFDTLHYLSNGNKAYTFKVKDGGSNKRYS